MAAMNGAANMAVNQVDNSPAFTFLQQMLKSGRITAAQYVEGCIHIVCYSLICFTSPLILIHRLSLSPSPLSLSLSLSLALSLSLSLVPSPNTHRATEYKERYQELHSIVIRMYASETQFLSSAKHLNDVLLSKKGKLDKLATMCTDTGNEIKKMRKELVASNQSLSEVEDHRHLIRFEQEELERNKQEKLESIEAKRRTFMAQVQPRIDELDSNMKLMNEEMQTLRQSKTKEEAATAEYKTAIEQTSSEIHSLEKEKETTQRHLQTMVDEPHRMKMQREMLDHARLKCIEQAEELRNVIGDLEEQLEGLFENRKQVENERIDLGYKLEMLRAAIDKRERSVVKLKQNLHEHKDLTSQLQEERAQLDWERKQQKVLLHHEQEAGSVYSKECEKTKKRYEKLRRRRELVQGMLPPIKDQADQIQDELKRMEAELGEQQKAIQGFKQDEELFISQYLAHEKLEEDTNASLRHVKTEISSLEEKIEVLDKEERGIKKLISELEHARETMARSASAASGLAKEVRENVKVKDLITMDLEKQMQEIRTKLANCSQTYEVIKNQRNKFASQTQSTAQALAEMRENIKILESEVDILRQESVSRDRAVAEEKRIHDQAKKARNMQRIESNKQATILHKKKDELMKHHLELDKLNATIAAAEAKMIQIRQQYSVAVEARNRSGMCLIDRNDELAILYEKGNLQAKVLSDGQIRLREKEDEVRQLELQIKELERRVETIKRKVPSPIEYENAKKTLEKLQLQLDNERRVTRKLAKELEAPIKAAAKTSIETTGAEDAGSAGSNPASPRVRKLPGTDASTDQLLTRLEVLEERLHDKREQLLEKDLILDEVTMLSENLRKSAAEGRMSMLNMAKQVNDYQAKIRAVTRKMMATVSELSMYQAQCIQLQQSREQQKKAIIDATRRMREDQPPTDDCESEWLRMQRDRALRKEAVMNRTMELQQLAQEPTINPNAQSGAPDYSRTTALPRPNAYIDNELGLPKPYGGAAPFKPSAPGANMRHIRKPVTKPVEI
jgi:coiled-coil domain-containing protein 146